MEGRGGSGSERAGLTSYDARAREASLREVTMLGLPRSPADAVRCGRGWQGPKVRRPARRMFVDAASETNHKSGEAGRGHARRRRGAWGGRCLNTHRGVWGGALGIEPEKEKSGSGVYVRNRWRVKYDGLALLVW